LSKAYKQAGVNLQAGYETVARLRRHVKRTERKGVSGDLGGFGGLFDLGSLGYKNPVLVSGTDGVGTKLMIAFLADKHDTIGIDAVAMCVNDVVVQGAEPLFFLDYLACGRTIPDRIEDIVSGVAEGCVQAGCALIGGETAEMPGLYDQDEYDIAGFAVGACEKEQLINGSEITEGDILIGMSSSGLHSNGYSLVRKILLDYHQIVLDEYVDELGCTWAEELLKPTRIYVKPLLPLVQKKLVKGMAHITGGGFIENIPRILPAGLGATVKLYAWQPQPIFSLLENWGKIPHEEMFNVFNMGIGMVLAVDPNNLSSVLDHFAAIDEDVIQLGHVHAGEGIKLV